MTTDEKTTTLAASAYHAYGAVTDHKNYQGLPMPEWSALPEKIQTAWRAAVIQVGKDLAAPTVPSPKFQPGDAVEVVAHSAIIGGGATRWIPGVVVEISGRDEFANTWLYRVATEEHPQGAPGTWSSNVIRPRTP